jgi:hypothetical protein
LLSVDIWKPKIPSYSVPVHTRIFEALIANNRALNDHFLLLRKIEKKFKTFSAGICDNFTRIYITG